MRLNKSKENISSMFDDIAVKYDFLNHFFTANLDKVWRRKIIKYLRVNNIKHDKIVDLATGTGDMAMELLKLNPLNIYAFDISPKMLDILRSKQNDKRVIIDAAESEKMPIDDSFIDLVTIAFGVRNFENMDKSLKEINRILKPGGYLIVLEMFNLEKRNRLFEFYFTRIMPKLGKLISRSDTAYSYLHKSVLNFKTVKEFISECESQGYKLEYVKNNFQKFVYSVYLRKI